MRRSLFALGVVCSFTSISWAANRAGQDQPPILDAIHIDGNHVVKTDDLIKRVTLSVGKPLSNEQFRFSAGIIGSVYRDRGYYEVFVATSIETTTEGHVNALFSLSEGDLYHVGAITIDGNKIVQPPVILRTLDVKSGQLFSQNKIFDGNRQLYMTGYFDQVDIAYSTTSLHTVDIHLHVRERATRYIKGGFGYGTQTKERVTLGWEDLNFFGHSRKLDVSATHSGFVTTPSKDRTSLIQTTLVQPYIFNSNYQAQTNIAREWDDREPYDSISTAWTSSVGKRFNRAITASLRYRYSATDVTRVSPDTANPGFTNISAVGPTFTYDNTNDPFLPSQGWRIIGTYEEGMRVLVGDVRFHKLESRVGRFDTGFAGITLYEDIQAGMILPDSTSDKDVIPVFERYYIGGANTVRGYGEKELGPRDASGALLGGNSFLVGNVELRHRLYQKLYGTVFLDGGQLYPTDPGARWPHADFKSIDDFRYATGFGFRLHTPVGAVRLELGYQLNPQGGTSFFDRTGLHFSIGEDF